MTGRSATAIGYLPARAFHRRMVRNEGRVTAPEQVSQKDLSRNANRHWVPEWKHRLGTVAILHKEGFSSLVLRIRFLRQPDAYGHDLGRGDDMVRPAGHRG